jgi:hypothetical protein
MDVTPVQALLWSLLTLLLGGILGHRLQLGRDRRKEFNEAAAPVRGWVLKQIESPCFMTKKLTAAELDAFLVRLPTKKRSEFERLWSQHQTDMRALGQAIGAKGGLLAPGPIDPSYTTAIQASATSLLPYTDPH